MGFLIKKIQKMSTVSGKVAKTVSKKTFLRKYVVARCCIYPLFVARCCMSVARVLHECCTVLHMIPLLLQLFQIFKPYDCMPQPDFVA